MSHFLYATPFNLPLLEDSTRSEAVTVRALIRNHDFGCLIGKDGSRHRRLERDFRVKVYFLEPDKIIHDRLVSIAGTAYNVARAWREVVHRMFERCEPSYGEKPGVKVLVPDCLAKQMVMPFNQLDDDDSDYRGRKENGNARDKGESSTKARQMNKSKDEEEGFGQDDDGFEQCKCELEEIIYDSGAYLVLDDESLYGSTDRCLQVIIDSLDDEALERFEAAMELIAECFIRHRYLAMSPMNTYYAPDTYFQKRPRRSENRAWSLSSSSPSRPASEDGQGDSLSIWPVSSSPLQQHNLTLWKVFSQNSSTDSDNSSINSHNRRPNLNATFDTPPSRALPPLRRHHHCFLKLLLANEEAGMLLANRGGPLFLAREIERASMTSIDISVQPPYNRPIRGLLLCQVSHIPPVVNDWYKPSDIYRFPRVARVSATVPAALVDACMRIAISISTHGLVPFRHLRNGEAGLHIIIPADSFGPLFGYGGHRVQALRGSTGALISQADEILPESEERVLKVVGTIEEVEEVLRRLLVELEKIREPHHPLREYDPLGMPSQVAERSRREHGDEF